MAAAAHPEVTPAGSGAPWGAPPPFLSCVCDGQLAHTCRDAAGENCGALGRQSRSHRVPHAGAQPLVQLPQRPQRCRDTEQDPDRGPPGSPGVSSRGACDKGTQPEECGKDGARSLAFCTFWLEHAKNSPASPTKHIALTSPRCPARGVLTAPNLA